MSAREPATAANEARKAELRAAIERAFSTRPYPGHERLCPVSRLIGDHGLRP